MCKHENNVMTDFQFSNEIHDTVYQCLDCGDDWTVLDCPRIQDYPSVMVYVNRDLISLDDLILLGEKAKLLKK